MPKIAVFFDVQNLYHSAKLFCNDKISYKHLMEAISKGREVSSAVAYAAHKDIKESRNFYSALEAIGINVYSKRVMVKHGKDKDSKVIPVHFDVEIATDALTCADDVDTVVLCTGNGNFAYLIKALLDDGLHVEVWSFSESTSSELLNNENITFRQIPTECLLGHLPKESEKVEVAQWV